MTNTSKLACAILGVLLIGTVYRSPPEPARTHQELCRELALEVRLSVELDLLTEEQAQAIVNKCWRIK